MWHFFEQVALIGEVIVIEANAFINTLVSIKFNFRQQVTLRDCYYI